MKLYRTIEAGIVCVVLLRPIFWRRSVWSE